MMTTFLALSVSASVKERPRSKGVQDLEELWTDIGELGEELLLCGIGLVRQRERDRLVGIIHQRDAIVASHGNFFNTGQGRKTVDAVNKDIPITHLEPMQLLVDRAHSESRFASLLATLLGVIALVLPRAASTVSSRTPSHRAPQKSASAWPSARRALLSCA
jgi:hypothetical protein